MILWHFLNLLFFFDVFGHIPEFSPVFIMFNEMCIIAFQKLCMTPDICSYWLQKQVSDLDLGPTKVFGWSATFCSALDSGGDRIAITDLSAF